jgi:hypothetical protein
MIERNKRRRHRTDEVPALSRTFNRDGVMVRTRCHRVATGGPARFEIVIEGYAQSAIIDVPDSEEAQLGRRLEEAVSCFIESIKLRSRLFAN